MPTVRGWRFPAATRRCAGRGRRERGMVTAELAVAVPGLVVVACVLAWLLSLGVSHALVTQAAREGARAAARGDSASSVRSAVHALVPEAQVSIRRVGGHVQVSATLQREPPMSLLAPLAREVRATATSWWEEGG